MGRFIVTLTDDHRVRLEAYRKAHGLRSEAEAVRHMIDAWRIESMIFGSAAIKISDDGFVERVDASVLEKARAAPDKFTMADVRGPYVPRPKKPKGEK